MTKRHIAEFEMPLFFLSTEVNSPRLSATSHIPVQVEQTRLELVKWLGLRWLAIRQEEF